MLLGLLLALRSCAFGRGALLIGTLLLAPSATALADPPNTAGKWTLAFSDEFFAPELDPGKWTLCYWWDDQGCTNKGNHELQWYVPDGATIKDGNLALTATKRPAKDSQGNEYPFSSGMVTSGFDGDKGGGTDRFSFTYGYVEVRAKLPKGKGLWPAIWLLPSTHQSLPEIDMAEMLGDTPSLLRLHYHYAIGDKSESAGKNIETPDLSLDWHVYAMDWEKDAIVWYLDGVEQWRYVDVGKISREPMYLLMNLAVGGDWPGSPAADTVFPASMLVDYVRVWQETSP